jgi:hypothetical protein
VSPDEEACIGGNKAQHTGVATRGREVSVHVLGAQ